MHLCLEITNVLFDSFWDICLPSFLAMLCERIVWVQDNIGEMTCDIKIIHWNVVWKQKFIILRQTIFKGLQISRIVNFKHFFNFLLFLFTWKVVYLKLILYHEVFHPSRINVLTRIHVFGIGRAESILTWQIVHDCMGLGKNSALIQHKDWHLFVWKT